MQTATLSSKQNGWLFSFLVTGCSILICGRTDHGIDMVEIKQAMIVTPELKTGLNGAPSGLEGNKFKTRCQQGLFIAESPLYSTLPLVIFIENINSCAIRIG